MNIPSGISDWLNENAVQQVSLLILAARQGRADVLDYLLQGGADLIDIDTYGNNALWAACYSSSLACIETLVNSGINLDYQNPSGASALIYASSSGKHSFVELLLKAGANPLLTTDDDFSALDLAANRQCLQLLRHAVKKSEDKPALGS